MKNNLATHIIAGILLLVIVQVYVVPAFATAPLIEKEPGAQQTSIAGILTTKGNKPITVNGAAVKTGSSIVDGAIIETPDDVPASVAFPGHGSLNISPKSRVSVQIDAAGNIIIKITGGCAGLHLLKGTSGEVDNDAGVVGKSDGSTEMTIDNCPKTPSSSILPHHGLFGLGLGATIAIIAAAGGGAALAADFTFLRGRTNNGASVSSFGSNPSPSGL